MKLLAKYSWFPQRGEWIGVVAEAVGDDLHVLTAGCERDEAAVAHWCREQVALIERTGDRTADYPDMHDRAKAGQLDS
jgi:hypothetical protein